MLRGLHRDTMTWLKPQLHRIAEKADAASTRTQLSGEMLAHVDSLVKELGPKVVRPFAHLAGAVDRSNRKAMDTIGLDIRGQLGPHIDDFREWNQSLIKNAGREYVSQIAEVLDNPDTWGLRVEEITALLAERGDVSESKAKLIARDQTQKLNAAVNQFRQRSAGVGEYEWSGSLDEREREEHLANEGQTFAWGSPPAGTGDPGDDVNCRCIAIPVIPELEDDDESVPVEPDEPSAPAVASAPEPEQASEPKPEQGLEVGREVLTTASTWSEQETQDLMSSIDDAPTKAFLEKVPLRSLELTDNLTFIDKDGKTREAGGLYTRNEKKLQLAKKAYASGDPFNDQLHGVAMAATTPEKYRAVVFHHELGHHIHLHDFLASAEFREVDDKIQAAFARAQSSGVAISKYAMTNEQEYFAENYTAYRHFPEVLKKRDPRGYSLVETVLALRGIQ